MLERKRVEPVLRHASLTFLVRVSFDWLERALLVLFDGEHCIRSFRRIRAVRIDRFVLRAAFGAIRFAGKLIPLEGGCLRALLRLRGGGQRHAAER